MDTMKDGNHKGWTFDSFEKYVDERDRRYAERFDAQEKAVDIAQSNVSKWQANANEWREAMDDRERNFLPKSMGYVIAILTVFTLMITLYDKLS